LEQRIDPPSWAWLERESPPIRLTVGRVMHPLLAVVVIVAKIWGRIQSAENIDYLG